MRSPLWLLWFAAACDGNETSLKVYQNPPAATITSPADGETFAENTAISFTGLVSDREDPAEELALVWASTADGTLSRDIVANPDGTVLYTANGLTVGTHTITLTAIDHESLSSSASVTISVFDVPEAPSIVVVRPVSGDDARDDEMFTFSATVADNQDTYDLLAVEVESTTTGPICEGMADAAGAFACAGQLEAGDHDLIFTVTDSSGLSTSVGAALEVNRHTAIDDDGDGWNEEQGDCDDSNATVSPAVDESFNGIDDDCNDIIDDGTTGYDDDGDGYTEIAGDCNDNDASSYPGGEEVYDAADNDCDGIVDDETEYYDDDGDRYTEASGDCDDGNIATYPYAPELEDGADNDCDGVIDEGTSAYDDDLDGWSENAGDCNDADPATYPGASENYADAIDQDCDGVAQADYDGDGFLSLATGGDDCDDADEYTYVGAAEYEADPTICATDEDEDGFGSDSPRTGVTAGTDCDDVYDDINPLGEEVCDNDDNNCDGTIDEENADGCTTYYYDYDGDGYGNSGVSGSCLCDPTGYYTSSYNTDCYDYNVDANPAQTSYSTSTRGDTSYDWNCDATEEKYWRSTGSCTLSSLCTVSEGWQSTVRSCGTAGTYITGCSISWTTLSCSTSSSSYTQKCR